MHLFLAMLVSSCTFMLTPIRVARNASIGRIKGASIELLSSVQDGIGSSGLSSLRLQQPLDQGLCGG